MIRQLTMIVSLAAGPTLVAAVPVTKEERADTLNKLYSGFRDFYGVVTDPLISSDIKQMKLSPEAASYRALGPVAIDHWVDLLKTEKDIHWSFG
jgi:hypothetical protein